MVRNVLFGLFGVFAYILPIVLFFVTAFSISNKDNTIAAVKGAAMIAAGFLLCALFQLIGGEKGDAGSVWAFYTFSSEHRAGGGFFGGLICKALKGAFGTAGAWIIVLILLIICAVVITERSFIGGVRKGSRKVYDTAREDARRHRIQAEERRAARQKAMQERENAEREEYLKPEKVPSGKRNAKISPEQEEKQEEEVRQPRTEHKVSGVALEETVMKKDSLTDEMREITLDDCASPELQDLDEMFRIPIHRERNDDIIRMGEELENAQGEKEEQDTGAGTASGQSESTGEEKKESAACEKPHSPDADSRNLLHPRKRAYIYPPLRLLNLVKHKENRDTDRILHDTAMHLQQILRDFGVGVTVTDVSQGPAVTRYELQPDQGVKVSRIVALSDDIKLNLAVSDIRIEAPIPGKAAIGIEVPNRENTAVALRELLESREFRDFPSNLAFAVGKDIAGKVVVSDIAKMPHMLIAGATGSGKSVCINTLIMSILYKARPEDVKLILVDPKVVELSVYNGIPHLLIPVVTDPKKASAALQWGVAEMSDRYRKFADFNVRDLKGYNQKAAQLKQKGDPDAPAILPQIVIIVDELADLMMVAPGEVEESICRLAQLARAAGIHLIIATQRPSVDVITGLIKANMPSRVAFAVSSGVDSRTILDMNGAEKLLGKGDMLFYPQGYSKPARVQGAFVSDTEVSDVVDFLKNQAIGNVYSQDIEEKLKNIGSGQGAAAAGPGFERDEYFVEAGQFIIEKDKASIGMLQRAFKIGFNRAARIMDQLAEAGVVGEEEGTKPRKVLMSPEQFEQYIEENV